MAERNDSGSPLLYFGDNLRITLKSFKKEAFKRKEVKKQYEALAPAYNKLKILDKLVLTVFYILAALGTGLLVFLIINWEIFAR